MCHLDSKYIIQTHFENVQIYTSEKFTTILCMCVSFDNIITEVVSSNPAHGDVYSIQHNVIKFVSDLRQLGVFFSKS
jgi:hypothetical protein